MNIPFHPIIVHLPIALTLILPFLILVFALMIKGNKMNQEAWLVIIGLQLLTTATGYISLESGENEEHVVEKIVDKKLIHHHEEAAEVFVGSTVIALVLSIASYFLRKELQFTVHLVILLASLASSFLVFKTGESGGELVYRYGAADAYLDEKKNENPPSGLLPTPGMNTSESSYPVEENESLKADDNDYGNSDESEELEDDDDSKQED